MRVHTHHEAERTLNCKKGFWVSLTWMWFAKQKLLWRAKETWIPTVLDLDLLQAVYLVNNPKIAGVGQGWRMGRDSLYIPENSFVSTREESWWVFIWDKSYKRYTFDGFRCCVSFSLRLPRKQEVYKVNYQERKINPANRINAIIKSNRLRFQMPI